MKKAITILFLLLVIGSTVVAQNGKSPIYIIQKKSAQRILDSLKHELSIATQDTSRVLLMAGLLNMHKFTRPDSALFFGHKAMELARRINFPKAEVMVMRDIALSHRVIGNDSKALQMILQAIKIAEKHNMARDKSLCLLQLGEIYIRSGNYSRALSLLRESKILSDSIHSVHFSIMAEKYIAETYLLMNQPDSALYYGELAYERAVRLKARWVTSRVLWALGKIQNMKGNTDLALAYFKLSLPMAITADGVFHPNFLIAQLFQQIDKPDSCIYYANKSLQIAQESGVYSNIIEASILLSTIYENRDVDKALQYNKLALASKDSLYNLGKSTAFESFVDFDEQERRQELEAAEAEFNNRLKMNVFLGSTFTLIVIAILLFRNSRNKQKAKQKIEHAYTELKTTQSQLIQSEKMASLGELTAGIAHEIQNPLNFVNNFSEVNAELAAELLEEIKKGNVQGAEAITTDIINNEKKIVQHGKRADAIVKGMLQHSRSSSGIKEPTDINVLADEYLRLAYHGLRAKDKEFNATMKTDFDNSIGNINIIPQDMGRVVLNLITNAFYAVTERRKLEPAGYEPTVTVSTKKVGDSVEISVEDNGNGLPDEIKEKIFQPFFTTKPTGQGTGLGLSMSYDIVKAHGGELKVNTTEEEGAEFIVRLPNV